MNRLVKVAWPVVLGMTLLAAGWSISDQLIRWGMPHVLAYGISVMFDAGGLICALYAQRAVERGTSAGLPRLSILAFASMSGLLNYHHGVLIGGHAAGIGFASTSALVELLFELHRRDARDEHMAQRGLIAELLPRIPLIAWVMFPLRSLATLRDAVATRLAILDPIADTHPDKAGHPSGLADATVRSAIRAALATTPGASPADIVATLSALGIQVTEDDVRTVTNVHPIRPSGRVSIADIVRTEMSGGNTDPVDVLAAVRAVHGQKTSADTVLRTMRRIAPTIARSTAP